MIPLRYVRSTLVLSAAIALARFCTAAQMESAPSAAEVIRRSVSVNTADWNAQPRYSYREVETKSKIDADGQARLVQSRTYEVTMLEGSPYNRLVAVDNGVLSPVQQQQEYSKLRREINSRQNESASDRQARISKYEGERAEEHLLMQQLVAAFHFRLNGSAEIDGTDCFVLDAVPNPDYRPPVSRAKVLTGMQGRLWIDKGHYHWVKVEAEVIRPVEFGLFIAKVKPGTRFELDQAPAGDVWLPKHFMQTVRATLLGVYGVRTREESHYSNYRLRAADNRLASSAISLLPVHIAMALLHREPSLLEPLPNLMRDQYRPVMSARASERDCKIAFPFAYVVRQ